MTRSLIASGLAAVLVLSLATVATAATENWIAAGSGNWSTPGNWNPASVPIGGDTVTITPTNGVARTVTYDYMGFPLTLAQLNIDLTGPGATTTTLSMSANNLSSSNEWVGVNGRGTVNHSGGTNTIAAGAGIFSVGRNPGSTGTYNLGGTGALVANTSEYIGNSGTGVFNQTGGTNTISGAGNSLYLGFGSSGTGGTYTLSGGTVTAPEVFVGYASTGGSSNFTITGAGSTVNATTSFVVGRAASGSLLLADGGTLAVGNGTQPLQISTVASNSGVVYIGNGGAAGVLQASAVQFGQPGQLNFNHTGNLTFATPISGPGIVTKTGPGTTTLSATNSSYSGPTILSGGSLAISADRNLGMPPGSFNSQQLQFTGGTLRATQSFTMDVNRGIVFGGAGGTIEVDATETLTYPNNLSLSAGTMTKTGAGTLSLLNLGIGVSGSSALVVTGGGTLASGTSSIGGFSNVSGSVTISGPGTTWTTNDLFVGLNGIGTLEILGGGTLTSTSSPFIGYYSGSTGTATVRGAGSTWNVGGDLTVGYNDDGTLNIEDQALVHVGYSLNIVSQGVVNLSGGTLRFDGYIRAGTFNFNSGTIQLAGDRSVGTDAAIKDLFGAAPIIPTGKGLTVEETATLLTSVTLDGGTFTVGALIGGSNLHFERGTLNVTNQAVTIGPAGPLGSTLDLASDMTVNVSLGITNQGLVTGDGQIGGTFSNAVGGELRAEPGRSLKLTGSGNANSGQINLFGGLIEFTQNLTNNAGGFISGNGTLIVRNGLVNNGTLNFSGSANVVGDTTNSPTGKIISAGGGPTTFFDDVTNRGEIRTSAGSFTVFFGAVTGAGTFTGLGTVNFEGDLKPGNSPAAIQFAGDVAFGSEATLQIELGGTTPGSEHDQLNIAGMVALGGTLDVDLLGGFTPTNGNEFVLATYASRSGQFSALDLPPLASNLAWSLDYRPTSVTLSVTSTRLPGDIDEDGDVDRRDAALFTPFLATASGSIWTTGDFDGDGMTSLIDLALQQVNFGATLPSPAAASAAVPEPSSIVLLLAGLIATGAFVRRATIRRRFYKVLIAALIGLSCGPAQADVATWTGDSGNGNWSAIGNWNPAAYPAFGDSAIFGNSAQTNVRADFSSYPATDPQAYDQPALHLESLTFDAAAPSYTIELYSDASMSMVHNAKLEFDGAGVVNSSGQAQTFIIDESFTSLFNYPPASSIVFNNAASAANASYHAQGGTTEMQPFPFGGGEGAARSSAGRVSFNGTATAATGTFIADGGSGDGGQWARVEFHGNSTAASGTFTNNGGVNGPSFNNTQATGFGAQTTFSENANAGDANFTNQGNATLGGSAGFTIFTQNSSAARGVFVNNGGTGANADGGQTGFSGNATAGNGTFTNNGGTVQSASGGWTQFHENASAASGTITNNGGTTIFALGGQTIFRGASTAGFATLTNAAPTGVYGYAGKTSFFDSASAGSAVITNLPSEPTRTTTTDFYGTSTAAGATIINKSGPYPTVAGITTFHDSSSAGSGTFINETGQFNFEDFATAGQGTFTNGAFGGLMIFKENSTAGQANIVLRAKANSVLIFRDDSSAGAANIDVGPLAYGEVNEFNDAQFYGNSTAANSTITVRGDGGSLSFAGSTAGNATIVALGSTRPGNISGTVPGQVLFNSFSTAGNATITAQPATVAGAPGGLIVFLNGGHAGAATLIANGGSSADNGGGIRFQGGGFGDSARLVVNAGAYADFSHNAFHGDTAVGSIEGAGRFSLGGSLLTVGSLNTNTTVSGNITDVGGIVAGTGGRLTKIGTGALTLSGTNVYTGLTTVDEGTLVINGSIAAGAVVKDGGILKGTGSMGNVAVEPGGVFAPGTSPGTITVGGLNLMSGSTLQYELGAIRDRIVVTNNGNVTLAGILNISLLDGFIPTEPVSLFEGAIGSITGAFSAVNAPIVNGHSLNLIYSSNQVLLEVSEDTLPPGDANGDNQVDRADLALVARNYGLADGAFWSDGDFDGNGGVDLLDVAILQSNFGPAASSPSPANINDVNFRGASVPEPSSLVLAALGLAGGLLGWRRRRRRLALDPCLRFTCPSPKLSTQ